MEKIRWGILSTGHIAGEFAKGLAYLPDAELVAVGSRTAAAAEAFGARFNIPHRHASYEALAGDRDVDVIYIATPHSFHYTNALLCLNEGKAALVEKAFTLNAIQAADLIATARRKNLFLMEAMWTRFLPHMVKVRQLIQAGAIGEVRLLTADLGFRAGWEPQGRLLNPDLAGGALLDVGCYVVSFASMVMGNPTQVTGLAHLGQTGVDEQAAILLGYPGGRMALLACAVRTASPQDGYILGTEGWIRLHATFTWTHHLSIKHPAGAVEPIEIAWDGTGYHYEAAEVHACLRAGRLESETMPLAESLEIMRTLDQVRQQAGFRYPEEL